MFCLKTFVILNWWTQKSLNWQEIREFFLHHSAKEINQCHTAPSLKEKKLVDTKKALTYREYENKGLFFYILGPKRLTCVIQPLPERKLSILHFFLLGRVAVIQVTTFSVPQSVFTDDGQPPTSKDINLHYTAPPWKQSTLHFFSFWEGGCDTSYYILCFTISFHWWRQPSTFST